MKDKTFKTILVVCLIIISIFFIVLTYKAGYSHGALEGQFIARNQTGICGYINGTMESDDYCLIVDQRSYVNKINLSSSYREQKLNCSWGKYKVRYDPDMKHNFLSNQKLNIISGFLKCKKENEILITPVRK